MHLTRKHISHTLPQPTATKVKGKWKETVRNSKRFKVTLATGPRRHGPVLLPSLSGAPGFIGEMVNSVEKHPTDECTRETLRPTAATAQTPKDTYTSVHSGRDIGKIKLNICQETH